MSKTLESIVRLGARERIINHTERYSGNEIRIYHCPKQQNFPVRAVTDPPRGAVLWSRRSADGIVSTHVPT